jgi:hypothetical protein
MSDTHHDATIQYSVLVHLFMRAFICLCKYSVFRSFSECLCGVVLVHLSMNCNDVFFLYLSASEGVGGGAGVSH